ncbi:hypothetical protein ACFQH9_17280 [Pseudonocardia lutea]|uniref:DUF3303 domain-containing protein n=1 Tax=Pseudonocardia lutea TaxID=2172015 RepID=A0ABW1ICI3_9PSEU
MGQMYMQKFVYRDGATKEAIDAAWGEGFKAVARTGNWGDATKGVLHQRTYGTSWGGYVLIEVEDADAFAAYQLFHLQNYAHVVHVTYEPVYDMDRAFAGAVDAAR